MSIEQKKAQAETRVFKAVFPDNTNHYDTMFGGKIMSMMDEVAFITATRFARKKFVTVNSDKISFELAIPSGTIIELIGNIDEIGNKSVKVEIKVFVEQMHSEERFLAVTGKFTLVAIDENKKAIPVLD
jgi:acyl-CoA hydrolase